MPKVKKALLVLVILMCIIATPFVLMICTNSKIVTFKGKTQIWIQTSEEELSHVYDNQQVVFIEGENKTIYSYKDLETHLVWNDAQKEYLKSLYIDLDALRAPFLYSSKFKQIVRSLNNERQDWTSAEILETDKEFFVKKEIEGNKLKIDEIEKYLKDNFNTTGVSIDLENYLIEQPENFITTKAFEEEIVKWDTFEITYTNGFNITKPMVKEYFFLEDNRIVFDESKYNHLVEQINIWVKEDLSNYTTLGGTFKFTTHAGQEIELPGVNYGDIYNPQEEAEFLVEAILHLWPCVQRIPVMKTDMADDIQSNIVEVSIAEQHIWKWKNGQVERDADVVTGHKNRHDTPRGVYQILNEIKGVYLEGPGYRSWVDRWMRIWNGYGLHDATWRNKFGGEIYKTNGSHGCINLPYEFAIWLYDEVDPGTIVVIY